MTHQALIDVPITGDAYNWNISKYLECYMVWLCETIFTGDHKYPCKYEKTFLVSSSPLFKDSIVPELTTMVLYVAFYSK